VVVCLEQGADGVVGRESSVGTIILPGDTPVMTCYPY